MQHHHWFPVRFILAGRVPVAAEEDLKDYDPSAPIYRGWDSYRYAPKETDAEAGAETALERAMRLRQEFLDALKECGESAAQGIPSLEGGDESQVQTDPGTVRGVCSRGRMIRHVPVMVCFEACERIALEVSPPRRTCVSYASPVYF